MTYILSTQKDAVQNLGRFSPTVESLGYTYDEVGNVTKTVDAQGDGPQAPVQTTCYTHDNLSQLLMAWSANDDCAVAPVGDARGMVKGPQPFWLKYTYDDKGNRTQQKSLAPAGVNGAADETTDYTYNTAGHAHALTSTSRFTAGAPTAKTVANYTYDASGAVTGRSSATTGKTLTATYTDGGRTKTLGTTADGTTTYVYDADGNILIRRDPKNTDTTPATTPTVRTAFIGRDQHRVVAGTTGITTTRKYSHAGATIAERIGAAPVSWLFADANHTVSAAVATTAGGTIGTITRRFFDPFGKTLAPTTGGTWPDNNTFLNTPTNTLDLVDMGARLYDPAIGRFLSVDPILTPYQPRQNNGYNYGWNNPLKNPDPTGLWSDAADTFYQEARWDEVGANDINTPGYDAYQDFKDGLPPTDVAYCDICNKVGNAIWDATGIPGCANGNGIDCASFVPPVKAAIGIGKALDLLFGLFRSSDEVVDVSKGVNAVDNVGDATKKVEKVCSFAGNTLILMADGTKKRIRDIVVGDAVLAQDPITGETGPRTVTDPWVHQDILTDLAAAGEIITTTEDHPFWNATDREFARADTLTADESLLAANGKHLTITGIVPDTTRIGTAYNLSVQDLHTYFVGQSEILVHNFDGCEGDQWASQENLDKHFDRHGAEMDLESSAEYGAAAQEFLCTCVSRETPLLSKKYGELAYYLDEATGEFGITSPRGIVSYFIPDNPKLYYDGQSGF